MWNIWLAEAMRREIQATKDVAAASARSADSVTNLADQLAVTPTEDGWTDTNRVVQSEFELERPDAVEFFDENVVPVPDWELEGAAINPLVYSDTSRQFELRLSFTGWGSILRAVCAFAVYIGTACCLVGIVKTEIDYWTTLGGSAT